MGNEKAEELRMRVGPSDIENEVTPLPWAAIWHICVIYTGQSLQVNMVSPILVFMVRHYGVAAGNEHNVGFYTGLLAALFPFGQFLSSAPWGWLSDNTGRKLWLAFGTAVTSVSAILLGLCQSYWLACAVRLANGLLNCTLLVTKSMLAELCDKSNINRAFGILEAMWGVGAIIGALLAATLSDPCRRLKHPGNCPGILQDFPFLLPFLVMGLLSALGLVSSALLPETKYMPWSPWGRHQYTRISPSEGNKEQAEVELGSLDEGRSVSGVVSEREGREHGTQEMHESGSLHQMGSEYGSPGEEGRDSTWEGSSQQETVSEAHGQRYDDTGNADDWVEEPEPGHWQAAAYQVARIDEVGSPDGVREGAFLGSHKPGSGSQDVDKEGMCESAVLDLSRCTTGASDGDEQSSRQLPPEQESKLRSLLRDRGVVLSITVYSWLSFAFVFAEELFPIFAASPSSVGGLGLDSSAVSLLTGIGGAFMTIYMVAAFPMIGPRLGPLRCLRWGTGLMGPLLILTPFASLLRSFPLLEWVLLLLTTGLRAISQITGFTGMIVVNANSATPASMGLVTGLGQSLSFLCRGLAPACAGFAWSQLATWHVPAHQIVVWWLGGAAAVVTFILACKLPPSLDSPAEK